MPTADLQHQPTGILSTWLTLLFGNLRRLGQAVRGADSEAGNLSMWRPAGQGKPSYLEANRQADPSTRRLLWLGDPWVWTRTVAASLRSALRDKAGPRLDGAGVRSWLLA